MTLYAVRHRTRFVYEKPVSFARCNLRLKPIAWPGQKLVEHRITVHPGGQLTQAPRHFGLVNTTRLVLPGATRELDIVSESRIEVSRLPETAWESDFDIATIARMARESDDVSELAPANFLYPSAFIPESEAIAHWSAEVLAPNRPAFSAALDLSLKIQSEFAFDPDATKTETLPETAFAARAGVCQDFAQIMICALRAAGVPAAYASGYIRTIPPEGQQRLQGADATHGWVLAWCGPARGWIGFDPTNGIVMGGDHILMAVGRDYLDIAPIDGVFTGYGAQDILVEVDVEPIEA